MTVYRNNIDIHCNGPIGTPDGFDADTVRRELDQIPANRKPTVWINSGGGDVAEGMALYSPLKARGVDIVVTGLAASAASLICMAGQTITMTDGAFMMIHSPWLDGVSGNAAAMRSNADILEKMEGEYARIYAARTGKSEDEIREMLATDTWFTAAEAVAAGFADRVEGEADRPARLVAECRNIPPKLKKDLTMPPEIERAKAEAVAADRKRRSTILAAAEAEGRGDLADFLTSETDLPAETIVAALAKAPKAEIDPAEDYERRHGLTDPERRLNGQGLNANSRRGRTAPLRSWGSIIED